MFLLLHKKMVNLQLYAWVIRGRQRTAILKAITKPQTPTETCKKSKQYNEKVSLNNTSDILREFVKQGLTVCLNVDAKVGRLYKLTEEGEAIRQELMKE